MRILDFFKRIFGFGKVDLPKKESEAINKNYIFFNYEIGEEKRQVKEEFEQIENQLKENFIDAAIIHSPPDSTPGRIEREVKANFGGDEVIVTRYRKEEVVLKGPEKEVTEVKDKIGDILEVKPKRV